MRLSKWVQAAIGGTVGWLALLANTPANAAGPWDGQWDGPAWK